LDGLGGGKARRQQTQNDCEKDDPIDLVQSDTSFPACDCAPRTDGVLSHLHLPRPTTTIGFDLVSYPWMARSLE
jgi:hypothetical protein